MERIKQLGCIRVVWGGWCNCAKRMGMTLLAWGCRPTGDRVGQLSRGGLPFGNGFGGEPRGVGGGADPVAGVFPAHGLRTGAG